MDIIKLVKEKEMQMIKIRRDLHQIPELGLELPKTMEYISNFLDSNNISYKKLLNGNAIVAQIEANEKGKCFAIRTDCDGLPIIEETGLEFASKNGNMHACGHDGHMAMAMTALMVLNENRDKFKGTVKMLFQPGEEFPGGALPMIEEGCMENPKVDAVIGLHHGKFFPVSHGNIGVKAGALMASMDRFQITVNGKGSHGAQPHLSTDTITVASEIVLALQKIHSREMNPLDNSVVSVCQIHGGSTQNILPESVFLEGTVRALDENVRKNIAKRIEEIANGIAKTYGCSANVVYEFKYPVVENDADFTDFFVNVAKEALGDNIVEYIERPTMGGEDMSYFLQKAKGTFFMLTNLKDVRYGNHNPKFDVDEATFYKGATLFVATAMKYLNEGE